MKHSEVNWIPEAVEAEEVLVEEENADVGEVPRRNDRRRENGRRK